MSTLTAPTVADVIAAYKVSDDAFASLQSAITLDAQYFIQSALVTHAALAGGATSKAIATAAKDAAVGYKSVSAVARHARTGEVLSIGGDLDEAFDPRQIQACYDKTASVKGKRVVVSVTPDQHRAIVRDATDVMDAYTRLVKANRANLKALQDVAAAPAEETTADDSTQTEETEQVPVSVTETMQQVVFMLTAVRDSGELVEVSLLNSVQDLLCAIADGSDG